MEYVIIGIVIVAIITVVVFVHLSKSRKEDLPLANEIIERAIKSPESIDVVEDKKCEIVIPIEMLPAEAVPDENRLVEITDSKVLTHVNNLIPGLSQVGNATNNAVQAMQGNGEILYRAIIPNGAKLSNSTAMEGAFRGFYRGADGIKGHANLVAVETQKGTAVVANTAAAAMGVASMVVGQYYMNQINSELGEISDNISKVVSFQDNEYRSRIFSLLTHVKIIADFQAEIIGNDELRLSKISQLDSLEEECTKLLGQANLTLAGFAERTNLDYKSYELVLSESQNWFMYQKSLFDVLCKISDLRYTLHLGNISREQSTALLPTYTKQVTDTQTRLTGWHNSTVQRLNIDIEEARRKRKGIDGLLHSIPGLVNNDFNFRAIDDNTVKKITAQMLGHGDTHQPDESNLYDKDVQLIAKGGKVYYLPSADSDTN